MLVGTLAAVGFAPISAAATPGDVIDVVQVNGTTSASTAVSIVPMVSNGSTATTGTPIALPTAASGTNKPFTMSGSASSEGLLSLSGDGRYLTVAGYSAAPGTASVAGTAASSTPRVVARIDGAGTVDTSTTLGSAFDKNNPRAATTDDGSRFWATGNNSAASGIVVTAPLGAGSATSVSTAASNGRSIAVTGGNLYVSSDKTTPTGVYRVGSGLPTAAGQPLTALAGPVSPNGFALVTQGGGSSPDTLYVADGAAGIVKYSSTGSGWTSRGSVGSGGFAGLAARVENGGVQLYATTADGKQVVALFDGSGSGTLTGSVSTTATAPSGAAFRGVAFAPSGQAAPGPKPVLTPDDSALGNVIGDADNGTLGVTVSGGDSSVDPGSLTVTGTSSDQSVVPNGNIVITGSGNRRTLALTPTGVGTATITLRTTDALGRTGTTTVTYGASAAATDATSHWLTGASDSSAAVDVGDGYVVVGDDATNVLRLYDTARSGAAVRTFDIGSQLGYDPSKGSQSMDLEAAARIGDTIWWTGSMGNSSEGALRPSRSTLFATKVIGSGAATRLTLTGSYLNLRADVLAWDASNNDVLGLNASAAAGNVPKQNDGFNVEGMEFTADGSGAGYLGFRAPLENPTDRSKALVLPVSNLASLTSSGGPATFGAPMLWNLGGLTIRDMKRNASGQYLILAGSWSAGDSRYRLYTWDGIPTHQPVATTNPVPAPRGGWEAIVATPDPLRDGASATLIEDDGAVDFYANGSQAKDLALGLRKSRIDPTTVGLPVQSIAFTSTPPSPTAHGDSYRVAATGGASGLPVTFTASPADNCTVADPAAGTDADGNGTGAATVSLDAGTCTVTAHQDGGASYQPAPAQTQTFSIDAAATTITWPTPGPITYGTSIGNDQLAATANVDGTFAYDVAPGTVLHAGDHTITATFTPTDSRRYRTATASVTLTVRPAATTITFAAIADHTFGDAPVALEVTAGASSSPRTFATSGPCAVSQPTSGPVLSLTGAGDCSVTATQDGDADHLAPEPVTRTLRIAKAATSIDWATPAGITYGTAIGPQQLNAAASVAGSITYTVDDGAADASGQVPSAGSHTLHASFTPDDTADYLASSGSVTLVVAKAHPQLSWTPIASGLTYGDALGDAQLDAVADVAGTFAYDPPADTVLHAGTRRLTATFTPADTDNYVTGDSVTTDVTVGRAAQPLAIADPGTHRVGDVFTVTASGGRSGSPIVFTASGRCTLGDATSSGDPVVGTVRVTITGAGDCALTANQDGSNDYLPAQTVTTSLTAAKGTPTVAWPAPADITYGAALGAQQLNATASAPGTFAYTLDGVAYSGSVPHAGTHTLGVTFTPTASDDYDPVTASNRLVVVPAPQNVVITDPGPQTYGSVTTLSLSVTGGASGKPVTVRTGAGSTCTVSTVKSGKVTVRISGAGSCALVGTQAATADYAAGSSTTTFVIAKRQGVITLGAIKTKIVGAAPFAVSVRKSGSTAAVALGAGPSAVCVASGTRVTVTGVGTCTVTADQDGDANNLPAATARTTFAVTFGVKSLSSLTVSKAGSPLTVRLQLTAANGSNVSTASVGVHATAVDGTAAVPVPKSRPGRDFRYYDTYSPFYEFVVDTTGLAVGNHTLTVAADGDPLPHVVKFVVKS